jgi:hypothetical protein
MISANPALAGQVDVLEDIIEQTAVPKTTDQECWDLPGSSIPNNTYGYGRIDALAAVEAALALIETGIEGETATHPIDVYPNPFRDNVIVSLTQIQGEVTIEFFNLAGRRVMKEKTNGNPYSTCVIDMTGQEPGMYIYRVYTEHYVSSGKVIKGL